MFCNTCAESFFRSFAIPVLKAILSKQLVSPLLSVGAHLKYNSEWATKYRRRRWWIDLIPMRVKHFYLCTELHCWHTMFSPEKEKLCQRLSDGIAMGKYCQMVPELIVGFQCFQLKLCEMAVVLFTLLLIWWGGRGNLLTKKKWILALLCLYFSCEVFVYFAQTWINAFATRTYLYHSQNKIKSNIKHNR